MHGDTDILVRLYQCCFLDNDILYQFPTISHACSCWIVNKLPLIQLLIACMEATFFISYVVEQGEYCLSSQHLCDVRFKSSFKCTNQASDQWIELWGELYKQAVKRTYCSPGPMCSQKQLKKKKRLSPSIWVWPVDHLYFWHSKHMTCSYNTKLYSGAWDWLVSGILRPG